MGDLFSGLGNALGNLPGIGGLFQNPAERGQRRGLMELAQMYNQYRPELQQARQNALNNRLGAYQGANNAMNAIYGGRGGVGWSGMNTPYNIWGPSSYSIGNVQMGQPSMGTSSGGTGLLGGLLGGSGGGGIFGGLPGFGGSSGQPTGLLGAFTDPIGARGGGGAGGYLGNLFGQMGGNSATSNAIGNTLGYFANPIAGQRAGQPIGGGGVNLNASPQQSNEYLRSLLR